MAVNTESGNAKNAANVSKLLVDVKSFGSAFDPSADEIKIAALEALNTNLNVSLTLVRDT
ncbi:MAG TPA: hypothetical protein DEH02_07250 [Bacteroidales bacterium]|nr:MAG: hypothetical protein A2X01_08350 [Bacteroidetes bacterium GWF2_35_48]OFY97896.1 MAG: hypothetical protein A2491_15245 [Bacteroidetes bacterium RIFOXYC12_FULL_35_7]HBX50848.1 hypothetical protein [Bacteroidales bacterium]